MEDQAIATKGDKFRNEEGKVWTVEEVRMRKPGDNVAWGADREVVAMIGPGANEMSLVVGVDGVKRSEHGGIIPAWMDDVPPPEPVAADPTPAATGGADDPQVIVLNLHSMAEKLWDTVRADIGIDALKEIPFGALPPHTQQVIAHGANSVAEYVIAHIGFTPSSMVKE